jgi:hypothetical protein
LEGRANPATNENSAQAIESQRQGAASTVKTRALRITVFSILWMLGVAVIVVAALYWRLSQGPISLAFLGDSIENAINAQIPGMRISLGETEIELDTATRTPHVRAQNLVLTADDGQVLASAPKAGVALDASRLLRGVVSVTTLELIGPKVSAKRNLDGSIVLGIEAEAANPEQEIFVDPSELDGSGVAEVSDAAVPAAPVLSGKRLLSMLDAGGNAGTLSLLEEVRITRGALRFFDEANDATWVAPQADLAFRRTEGGFVIASKASVNSGGAPWRIEASATYRRAENNYTANIAIEDLVPANVADEIFALAQFARVNMPFSGHLELQAEEGGIITSATGQMFAGKGRIDLPDYIAKPIEIEEATFRIGYKGPGSPIDILESSILMTGSRADVKGNFTPKYENDGRLTSISFDLKSENASVDTNSPDPILVDRVNFSGIAAVEQQRLDINDLVVMSGNTGIRMRGIITGGDTSPGINVAGRLRDVSAGLLKKLWPPVMAPRTRTWITENIQSGRITEGTFQVNFPPNVLAQAQLDKQLPANVIDVRFDMQEVQSSYFKNLPVLQQGVGQAHLKDDNFSLIINRGFVVLPSGERVDLNRGQFNASDLLAQAVPGKFQFDVRGSVAGLLEFAAQPDLNISGAGSSLPNITGRAQALIDLQLPLMKNVPKSAVKLSTAVKLTDAALAAVMPGIDLTEGNFSVDVKPESIVVKGPARLNGVSSNLQWEKPRKGGQAKVEVQTVVDAKLRAKLGIKLDEFMSGAIPIRAAVVPGSGKDKAITVSADLSDVAMKIAAVGWSRPPIKGTRATFKVVDDSEGNRSIEDLAIDGKGLKLRGRVSLKPGGGFRLIDLDEIRLNEDDVFRARLQPGEDEMNLTLAGTTFDARPYIKNLISPAKEQGASQATGGGMRYMVNASFNTVIAHRGENIKNVKASIVARGNQITTATIDGKFLSGLPITVKLVPVDGGREIRVSSADGGATLRASNFYSKVAGGELTFFALMANAPGSPIRRGELTIRRFDVRNEAALAELDSRGRPKKSGPRNAGVSFKRLTLPFSSDGKFIRMCDIELKGNDLGAVAGGLIRKADGAIDITGTMIPAQGINGFLDDVPLLGPLLTGGQNEGIFGVTFAMGGTVSKPRVQANPASALLPGFLRKMSEFRNTCSSGRTVAPPKDRNN